MSAGSFLNGEALERRLGELAAHTDEPGRMTRLYLSNSHRAATQAVADWMRLAGMSARLDAAANVVGRYEGAPGATKTLLIGSHIDTVRNAGRYDGNLGVLTGIAVVAEMNRLGLRLPFAVEVIAFGDEEGVRFASTLTGSRAIAGRFDPACLDERDASGMTRRSCLEALGCVASDIPAVARDPARLVGYVEVHIEQGPVLEAKNLPVGVVTAINGTSRGEVRVTGEGVREIAVKSAPAGGVPDDGLVEVDRIGKVLEGGPGGGGGPGFEGGTEMDFAEFDAVVGQAGQPGGGFLELNGEMAGVVIDPQMGGQTRVAGMLRAELFEKMNCFGGGLEEAEGFGFEAKVEGLAGAVGQAGDVFNGLPKILADGGLPGGVGGRFGRGEFLEGAGQSADTAFHPGREEFGQQVEQEIGIGQAFRGGPIGAVNVFLDAGLVELAIGEAVDGEDVAGVGIQPMAELAEGSRPGQVAGGLVAEAEADGEGGVGAHAVADGQGMGGEGVEGFGPGFAPVDVGAIGQLVAVGEFHDGGNGLVGGAASGMRMGSRWGERQIFQGAKTLTLRLGGINLRKTALYNVTSHQFDRRYRSRARRCRAGLLGNF